MIHLIPVEGKKVRDPITKKRLTPKGVQIEEMNTYWFRRLQDGDVIEVTSQEKAEKAVASGEAQIPQEALVAEPAPAPAISKKNKGKGE